MSVYERLIKFSNNDYKEFQSKLVPNISKDIILGVKTPDMRSIAKEIKDTDEAKSFLEQLPHKYYEENLVHFFLISMIKDYDTCINEVNRFLPYVDCWPVSDQATPKVFAKNHNRLINDIKVWINSSNIYTKRFGIRMLMNEYLGDDFKEEYLELVANIKGDEYYLKMMIAWFFATSLAKRYDDTIVYFEKHLLDEWVFKKSIQKALESYRVSDNHKAYLKELKNNYGV